MAQTLSNQLKRETCMKFTYAPKQTTIRENTLQINNIEMYYEEYGAGKPLETSESSISKKHYLCKTKVNK